MPIRRSPNGARHTPPQPGRDRPEQVVAINRNAWSRCAHIQLAPQDARAYANKGNILYGLKNYEEALVAYEQATRLDPTDAHIFRAKGQTYYSMKVYSEALTASEQAIRLNPTDASLYAFKTRTAWKLRRVRVTLATLKKTVTSYTQQRRRP